MAGTSDKIIQLPTSYWRNAVAPEGAIYTTHVLHSWLAPRKTADYSSPRAFTIKEGETIQYFKGIAPGWSHIKYKGKNGYCMNFEVSVACNLPEAKDEIPF